MLISDLYQETISAITSNKVRSGLTILGIVIGIGSVIAMVAIGQGAQSSIEANIASIGSNLLTVTPGNQRSFGAGPSAGQGSAQSLTTQDADSLNALSGIKAIASEVTKRYQVIAGAKNTNTTISATVPSYVAVRSLEMEDGNFFTDQDNKNMNRVAVLGPSTRDDLFGSSTSAVGKTLMINKIPFRVIGVTKSKGGSGFGNQDDRIYVPLIVAQKLMIGNEYVSSIYISAIDQTSLAQVQQEVNDTLLIKHKISDPAQADFRIMNQADIAATASSITSTFTMLLSAIAGISLLVGGIGIMNMMLTNVTERTREIGLRKAIGAKPNDISNQFLAEAVMLTFIGGLIGIGLGWSLAQIVSKFAGIATTISGSSVLLAFGVSAVIGIIFGYYPARRAAKMSPIEALRFE
ncbi:MAG: ABC transporter permease [bacterium]